jgi:hypothetical protein
MNFAEFDNFSDQWLRTDCFSGNVWCKGADFNHNGSVTFDDLMQFVEDWWLYGSE